MSGKSGLWENQLRLISFPSTVGLTACVQLGRLKDTGNWSPDMVSVLKRNSCYKVGSHRAHVSSMKLIEDVSAGN